MSMEIVLPENEEKIVIFYLERGYFMPKMDS
jgi:hypothetical protein